jgi:hypothetical protein
MLKDRRERAMANQEQLDILKQGVQVWNQWQAENLDVQIDLMYANLMYADLTGALQLHFFGGRPL